MSKKTKIILWTAVVVLLGVAGWFFFLNDAEEAAAVAPAAYGLVEGDVIRATGDLDVYIVNDWGYKRLFVNPAIFNIYGHLGFDKVKDVTSATRDAFVTSGLFRNCESGDQKVYGLEVVSEDVANLHWVNMTGAAAAAEDAAFFSKVFCINNAEQALYGVGAPYTSLAQIPAYSRGGTPPPTADNDGFIEGGSTQGVINSWDVGYADESNLSEGQTGEVFVAEAELDDEGPLKLLSLDLWFEQTVAGKSMKPWNYLSEVTVLVNGKVVAEKAVTSDLFSRDGDEYRLRLTGLSSVLPSDETSTVSVEVAVLGNLDSADEGAAWNIELGDFRVVDETGFLSSGNAGVDDSFTIESPEMAEVNMKDAADDVDAQVIKVSETSSTNGVAVYSFDVEEKGGVDVVIDDLKLDFNTSTASDNVIARAYLYKGNTLLGDEAVPAGGVVLFEGLNLSVAGDGKATLTVKVDLRDNDEGARYAEGTTLSVAVLTADIALEDDNGNDETDITVTSSATSNTHELRTTGIQVALVSTEATVNGDGTVGSFKIVVDVTAFGEEADVTDMPFTVVGGLDPSGVSIMTTTGSDNVVEVGETQRFTLSVSKDPLAAGYFYLQLDGVEYDNGGVVLYTFGLDEFETTPVYIQAN